MIDYKPGDTLPNGAIVVEIENKIVLAIWPKNMLAPCVTWKIDPDGNTYWGNYYKYLEDAYSSFKLRTKV